MKDLDILNFDNQLTSEEILIRDSIRDYATNELMPRIQEANRNEIFDKNIYKELGKLGLLGATVQGYGCQGIGYVAYGLITCLLYTSPSPRDRTRSRMPSSA